MKSQRIKWILFVILLVVLIYIWWGNIKLFMSSSASPAYEESVVEARSTANTQMVVQLTYSEPRTNPFKRYNVASAQSPPPSRQAKPATLQVPPPSSQFRLVGAVAGDKQPQAVFQRPDESTIVLTLHDSLMAWQVVAISDTLVVLAHEKQRDTLILRDTP